MNRPNQPVTDSSTFLNRSVSVKVDRPLGSKHPKFGFTYALNYGFIPNTVSPDGEELDAYILGVNEAVDEFTGRCIAVIHRTNDDDDKLIVIPEGSPNPGDDAIRAATHFQEQFFESRIIHAA